jgi:hypothetical protein
VAKTIVAKNSKPVLTAEAKERLDFINALPAHQFQFDLLTAKAKVSLKTKSQSQNLTISLRMQSAQKIWISLNALGSLEVARVLLTTDSVKIVNRLTNDYNEGDYNYLSNMIQYPINFALIEALLIGNIPPQIDPSKSNFVANVEQFQFTQTEGSKILNAIFQKAIFKSSEWKLADTLTKNALVINYADYKTVGEYLFPSLINVQAISPKDIVKLNIQFVKIEKVNSLVFPFNAPK